MELRTYEAKTVEGKIKERFETIHNVEGKVEVFENEVWVEAKTYVEANDVEAYFKFDREEDSIDGMIDLFKEYVNFYQEIIDALEETKLIIEGEI